MAYAVFECARDQRNGELGWRMKGHPTFDPTNGNGVAHDMLEHAPNDNGSLEGEIQAIGGYMFVRLDSSLAYTEGASRPWDEMILSDIADVLFDDAMSRDFKKVRPVETIRTRPLCDEYAEHSLRRAVESVMDAWERESESYTNPERAMAYGRQLLQADTLESVLGHLRTGYRRAKRRFGTSDVAAHLFTEVRNRVDKLRCEEGYELRVTAHAKTGYVSIRVNGFDEDFYH